MKKLFVFAYIAIGVSVFLGSVLVLNRVYNGEWGFSQRVHEEEVTEVTVSDDLETRCPSDIPVGEFKAQYFDITSPEDIVYCEVVDSVVLDYIYVPEESGAKITSDELLERQKNLKFRIDPYKFGGSWIGYFDFEKEETKQIAISQSWSETKILIDDQVVYNSDDSGVINQTFTPGRHKIEVQFVSNYFIIGFAVRIQDVVNVVSTAEAQSILSRHISDDDTELWYVGLYESDGANEVTNVILKDSEKGLVLFLSSYEPISWNLLNAEQRNIKAVVLSSYEPGTEVLNLPEGAEVILIRYSDLQNLNTLSPECEYQFGEYYCENVDGGIGNFAREFEALKSQISTLTGGKRLTGFTGEYSLGSADVPNTILDDATYVEIEANIQRSIDERDILEEQGKLENVFN